VRLTRYDPTIIEGYPAMLCPYLMFYRLVANPDVLKQFTVSNEGAQPVHGKAAWHIVVQSSGQNGSQRWDFLIDEQSSTCLRTVSAVTAHGLAGTMTADYSRLNQSVRIVAPKVGSAAA
jgi:hypothetical protein